MKTDPAEMILVAHQRYSIEGCLCGWSELGKSHAKHQATMLREAGLLAQHDESSKGESVTPLKKLILDGLAIFTEDFAGVRTLVCVAEGEDQANWLINSLAGYHKVEVERPQ